MPISIYDSITGQTPRDYFLETEGPLASDDTYKTTPIQLGAMFFESQTEDYEIKPGEIVLADVEAAGSFTIDLPASPLANQKVGVILKTKSTAGRFVAINPNGKTIDGASANIKLTIQDWSLLLQYDGSEWRIINDGRFEKIFEYDFGGEGSVAFADDFSVFSKIIVEVGSYQASTTSTKLAMRFSTDLGSTFDTGNNYSWIDIYDTYGGGNRTGSGNASYITLVNDPYHTTPGARCTHEISNPSANLQTFSTGQASRLNGSGAHYADVLAGQYQTAAVVNGIQVLTTSGTMAAGKLIMRGIR